MQENLYTFLGSGQWSSWLVRGLERKSLEDQGQEGLGRGIQMVTLGVGTKYERLLYHTLVPTTKHLP